MHCPKKETLKYPTSNIPERSMKKKTYVPALTMWRDASGFFYINSTVFWSIVQQS